MTYQEEKNVLDKFREIYSDFPFGKEDHPDSPDFIISDDLKKIGIEITQIFHSEEEKQKSSEKSNFTDLVISKLVPLLSFHFSLTIDLIPEIGVPKPKRDKISSEVARFCAIEFSNLEDFQGADVEHLNFDFESVPPEIKNYMLAQGYRNLPKGVKYISMYRCDIHGESFNSKIEAACLPSFSREKLNKILKDKEKRLVDYKPCDEYWLIIWQGVGLTSYFKDIDFETPVSSVFDKIFILRNFQNDVITIKP